ncbi:MAG: SRPBCC domain-containing protein [Gammaproteobacteria bacterium]
MSARASSSADREVFITRIINAPRNLVFDAWVDSKHADKWMGPTGYTTVTQSMEVRPGGQWRFTMSGPQGVFPSRVTYIEVQKPARLVYRHGADKDDDPDAFDVTVTFEDLGDKTHITMHSVFPTAAARDKVVKEFKAIEGGYQTLERLEQQVLSRR